MQQEQIGRLLLHNTTSSPPPANTTATDVASSSRSYDPSYVAIAALVFFSFLFFLGFFALYARRMFSMQRDLLPLTNPPAAKGLDARTIKSLPILPYSDEASSTPECVVCLAEFEDGESVKVMPSCGHLFHPKCIDVWLVSRGSCPICRSTKMLEAGGKEGGGEVAVVVVGEGQQERKVCVVGESSCRD